MESGELPNGKEEIIAILKDITMKFRKIIAVMAFSAILFFSLNVFAENEFLKSVPDEVDLGTIEEGSPAAVTVTVQNTGDAPVEITNVRTN